MKIKVFEFIVSNWAYLEEESNYDNDYQLSRMKRTKGQIKMACDIEKTINDYLKNNNVELVDMKVDTIDIDYHNNGRNNTIKMIYTLIIKEEK